MHFNAIVSVELPSPVEAELEGEKKKFSQFLRSLGLNARDEAEAVRCAESYVLGQEVGGSRSLGTELFAIDADDVPDHVHEAAFAPLDVPGVYWASGRIFGPGQQS